MPRPKLMTHQTCSVCGVVGDRSTLRLDKGWDWFRELRLCPKHAATPEGKQAIADAVALANKEAK